MVAGRSDVCVKKGVGFDNPLGKLKEPLIESGTITGSWSES
ncbi:hypothetical protein JCM19238_3237 [Vibrio ponticus]|nr:hypothetical protein JCM19238_3237 [Vibrio ponticus]